MVLSVTAGVSRLVGKYTLRPRQNHVQWAQHTKQGRSRAFNSQLLTSPDEEPTGEAGLTALDRDFCNNAAHGLHTSGAPLSHFRCSKNFSLLPRASHLARFSQRTLPQADGRVLASSDEVRPLSAPSA